MRPLDDPRDQMRFYQDMTPARRFVTAVARMVVPIFMRREVFGVENIPKTGAVVLAANHLTNWDVFPLQISLPRPIFFMAKSELFHNPLVGALIRHLGGFPVQRGKRDSWALAYAENLLMNERMLGMFPEGTRSKGRGLRAAKSGAARLALAAGCPVIPVAISGTERVLQQGFHRPVVRIQIAEPIPTRPAIGAIELTDRIMHSISEMLPKSLQGVYPVAAPPGRS